MPRTIALAESSLNLSVFIISTSSSLDKNPSSIKAAGISVFLRTYKSGRCFTPLSNNPVAAITSSWTAFARGYCTSFFIETVSRGAYKVSIPLGTAVGLELAWIEKNIWAFFSLASFALSCKDT